MGIETDESEIYGGWKQSIKNRDEERERERERERPTDERAWASIR